MTIRRKIPIPKQPLRKNKVRGQALFTAALIALLLLVGCEVGSPVLRSVRIFYQNDIGGQTDPLMIDGHPLGGMGQREAFLAQYLGGKIPPVIIDGGDLIGRSPFVRHEQFRDFRLTQELFFDLLNSSGTDIFVPGEGDIGNAWEEFLKLTRHAKFQVVAANLMDQYLKKSAFPGSVILIRGEVKVGIVGVVSQSLFRTVEAVAKGDLMVEDPAQAIAREIDELLENKADLIIVVAHVDPDELIQVAKAAVKADLLFSGHALPKGFGPVTLANGSEAVFVEPAGPIMGDIRISLVGKRKPLIDGSAKRSLEQRVKAINAQLAVFKNTAGDKDPLVYFSDKPKTIDRIKELRNNVTDLQRELEKISDRSSYHFSKTELSWRYYPRPETLQRIQKYKKTLVSE